MLITTFFTDRGVPKTGLSVTISIIDLSDGGFVISDAIMTERGGGWYVYDFTEYDNLKDYGIIADGTDTLSNLDRYKDNTNETEYDTELTAIKVEIDAITIKLPSGNIAEFGEYTTLLNNIETYILRNLGLSQENYYLDQTVYVTYQEAKLLTEGRIRVYSDAVSVGTDSNVIATYIITATWTDDKLQTYKVVKQ